MLSLRKADDRGLASLDWLYSRHTFSFSRYYDPDQVGFSDLLVINDDIVQPGKGFGTHPHKDMEIFTYVLEGQLEHKDSMNNGSIIKPGDIQMMSAGTGIYHSEFNPSASETVHLLQIWIVPDKTGVTPRYQQIHVQDEDKRGQLRLVIAPNAAGGVLDVYQDIAVYAGLFDSDEQATLEVADDRYVLYIHLARGGLTINGVHLMEGDGLRVRQETQLHFSQGEQAEVLVFNMRAHELPEMA